MSESKAKAIDIILRIPDESMTYVIGVLQNLEGLALKPARKTRTMQAFFSAAGQVQVDAEAITDLREERLLVAENQGLKPYENRRESIQDSGNSERREDHRTIELKKSGRSGEWDSPPKQSEKQYVAVIHGHRVSCQTANHPSDSGNLFQYYPEGEEGRERQTGVEEQGEPVRIQIPGGSRLQYAQNAKDGT